MLDDEQVERYARQIVVPGIGAAGQEKLLRSTVLVVGHPRGCATAALYLRAAGVRVIGTLEDGEPDAVIVADASAIGDAVRARLATTQLPVFWYTVSRAGLTVGVAPGAALPAPAPGPGESGSSPFHDAGGCDAASVVCAILTGLSWQVGPFTFV